MIAENLNRVQEQIAAACQRAGRSNDPITLVVVSKTMPIEVMQEAVQAGVQHFGENRLEEASEKIHAIQPSTPLHWHMIGHIQTRKARDVVALDFDLIHSVDTLKLAERLNRLGVEQGKKLPILLEMNVSGESSKSGWQAFDWERNSAQLWAELEQVLTLTHLDVQGLMTMAPYEDIPEDTRPVFRALASLREALARQFPQVGWQTLSMGMSNDYEIAIEEGATLVRVGRAIFGERLSKL